MPGPGVCRMAPQGGNRHELVGYAGTLFSLVVPDGEGGPDQGELPQNQGSSAELHV